MMRIFAISDGRRSATSIGAWIRKIVSNHRNHLSHFGIPKNQLPSRRASAFRKSDPALVMCIQSGNAVYGRGESPAAI